MENFIEKFGDVCMNVLTWIFETKLGHFIFIMTFCVAIIMILAAFIPFISEGLISTIIGCGFVTILFAIFDKNKRWI